MELDLTRTAVGLAFLLVAAMMDWRRRVVKDAVWVAFGAVALALVETNLVLAAVPWVLHLMPAATAVLYFGVFFGKPMWDEDGFHVRPLRFLLYLATPFAVLLAWRLSTGDAAALGRFYQLLTMPGMIVVAHGMYEFNLLRGGADAKAAMALGLLFPGVYPHLGPLPLLAPSPIVEPILAVWFPLAFVVIVNAAVLFLVAPLIFLARNAAAGHASLPRALFGYRVPIDAVPKYVWFMDRVEDGHVVTVYFPRRREDRGDQIRKLKEQGLEHVWVTPQLPFVVAILIGYLLAVVVGNVLLAMFGRLGA